MEQKYRDDASGEASKDTRRCGLGRYIKAVNEHVAAEEKRLASERAESEKKIDLEWKEE